MECTYFKTSSYIKQAIKRDKLQHITVETGGKNIYIPQESKFIVTKDLLVDETEVFSHLWDTFMFAKTIDFTNFDFSEITTMENWFEYSYNLEKVIFPEKMNMPKLKSLACIFQFCKALKEVDLSWIETNSQVSCFLAFRGCENLSNLTFPKITLKSIGSIAENAYKLQKVKLPIELMLSEKEFAFVPDEMFKNCYNLKMIDMNEAKLVTNSDHIHNLKDLLEAKKNLLNVPDDCLIILP